MNRYTIATLCVLLLSGAAAADGPPATTPNGTAVYPGTESFSLPHKASRATGQPNDVTLNFPNADVHEVAKSILGDILGLNYAVDPSATGTVTVQTAEPVAKVDVLPILEESLSAAKLGLIKKGAVYTIIPLDKAKRQPQLLNANEPGYGSESIVLRYVNAVELKKLLDPLVPENSISQADPGRNIMLITGTADQRNALRELIKQFDVNWLHGMSFALLVPERTDAHMLQPELDAIVNTPNSPTQGLVKLVVIDRLNGILAISPQPQYLKDLKKWMEILDRAGGDNDRKLFVYHVQNGRAADLATVLISAFGGGSGQQGPAPHPTAPNLNATGQPSQIGGMQSGFGNQQTGTTGTGGFQSGGFQSGGFQQGGTFGQSSQGGLNNSDSSGLGSNNQQTPQNVSQVLQLQGSSTPISVSSDETNNAIVVYATQRQYAIISDALRQLDAAPLQVVIEAAITEVSLTKELQFGVQWLLNTGVGSVGFSEGTTSTPTQIFPGFSYVVSSGNEIQATLNALQSITTVRVISAPKVLVLNNHMASLQVGDQVPVSTGSLTTQGIDQPSVAESIQYLPTGVILTVTPRVNDSGLVLLDISQEVSDVKPGTSSATQTTPTIEDRKFTSSIAVHDGQTIALGGLIRDNNSHGRDGIPYLSQIPYIGALFGSTDNIDNRTELLVLLTPRVIRNAQDAKSITDELREKIGTVAPPGPPRGVIH
ncbi:MAG TPA: type II secretion system secretin GspD [Nitrolancea sp.]|nr:type II secretion system secretin GspD [Rhizomicrobium sp.]HVX31141.1 type II secretion system secretin GspD [Nitrolancea sp.]